MSASFALHPFFARRFNIPSIADDISKWEEAWEAVLGRLSSSEDVFPVLKRWWDLNLEQRGPSIVVDLSNRIREQTFRSQDLARKLRAEVTKRHFLFVALKDEQVKRHLLNGIKAACAQVSLRENARALCPEITINTMMNGGNPIFDKFGSFLCQYAEYAGASGGLALLESDWWKSAVSMPEPWPSDVQIAFKLLTIQRNEFITAFVLHTLVSLVREMNFTGPIANLVTSEGFFSTLAWSNTSAVGSSTTTIHCKHCTGSSEELGENIKFMVCTKCRSKAHSDVHYCSRSCQVADWKKHKSHCGKVLPPRDVRDVNWTYKFLESEPDGWPAMLSANVTANVTASEKASNPERPLSPALQRQVAVLRLHPNAEYIFFDDQDRPVPFTLPESDRSLKMFFRMFLEGCMFGPDLVGLHVIAEYMIVMMGRKPGLSVAKILAQLSSEFGVDVTKMLVGMESKKIELGFELGKTFLEQMSNNWVSMAYANRSENDIL